MFTEMEAYSFAAMPLTYTFTIGFIAIPTTHGAQVSTNGYISMDDTPQYGTLPDFPVADTDVIVAPFADHINTARTGSVLYTDFLQSYNYYSQFNDIKNFIRSHTGDDFFYGDRMMVAEWKNVPLYGASAVSFSLAACVL